MLTLKFSPHCGTRIRGLAPFLTLCVITLGIQLPVRSVIINERFSSPEQLPKNYTVPTVFALVFFFFKPKLLDVFVTLIKMAQLYQGTSSWTLYPALLSILMTEKERNHLEEAAMAHQCGRFADTKALFDHNLPTSSSIPMLAMEHSDVLTTQGDERERIKILESTLNSLKLTNYGVATNERLLLELMLLDAYYWAYGKTRGLLDKVHQVRQGLSQVNIYNLSDLEVNVQKFPVI